MIRHGIFIGLAFAAAFCLSADAAIINVPGQYATIQAGIGAATDGDTVLVQPGTYVENVNFNGRRITLASLFLTTGDSTRIVDTIIDGDSLVTVVTFENGEDSTAVLCGFTITRGLGEGSPNYRGGGITIKNSSSPIIKNNIIQANSAPVIGGGIFCENGNVKIVANDIIGNTSADIGGGISCGGNPTIKDNLISGNSAAFKAGGIYCAFQSAPVVVNNIIVDNSSGNGGGIACTGSNPVFTSNTIAENRAPEGAAIHSQDSNPVIVNCIVWAQNISVIWGSVTASYSDIQGGWEGVNNIETRPLFLDPETGNYNVCSQSPCINTGDPSMLDPDGTRADMGVFFPQHPFCDIGNRIFVSTSGDDIDGNGSEANPFLTIQHGIDFAAYYDTVIVENGVYRENIDFLGKPILLASRFLFTADTFDVQNTLINGGGAAPVVTFQSGEEDDSGIMGFTILNGRSTPALLGGGIRCVNSSSPDIYENIITANQGSMGAGIYCSISSPIIRNNTISDNTAMGSGGGIECADSSTAYIYRNVIAGNSAAASGGGIHLTASEPQIVENMIDLNSAPYGGGIGGTGTLPIIIDNSITSNSSTYGGGLFIQNSNALIRGNLIRDNEATGNGGGMYAVDSQPSMLHNRFEINSATSGGGLFLSGANSVELRHNDFYGNFATNGGAIYFASSSPAIVRNIRFNSNGALRKGGGLFLSNSSPVLSNVSMWFNEADSGGGIYCAHNSQAVMSNSIFWDNAAQGESNIGYDSRSSIVVSYSDIEGGWPGVGNIDSDPLYRDAVGQDLRLSAIACGQTVNSPCIDAGHPDSLDAAQDCLTGLGGPRCDMGAFGGGGNSTGINGETPAPMPSIISLSQNYPNPFNAQTIMRYTLAAESDVTVSIYNLLGQQLAMLYDGFQQPGEHSFTWDAAGYPSGIYFARFETSGQASTIKLTILK